MPMRATKTPARPHNAMPPCISFPKAASAHPAYGLQPVRFIPKGDRVKEQPDVNRLLFWTPTGEPDGYAEKRGTAVLYYDRTGKAVRVDTNPYNR